MCNWCREKRSIRSEVSEVSGNCQLACIRDCATWALEAPVIHQRWWVVQGDDGPSGSHRRARSSGSVEGHAALRPGLEPISEGLFQVRFGQSDKAACSTPFACQAVMKSWKLLTDLLIA